jgi:predicted GH43/DUF377 family glycosyl hydrolase
MNPIIIVVIATLSFSIAVIAYVLTFRKKGKPVEKKKYELDRHVENPVISPRPHQEWEANGTFNPAAVTDTKGDTHLLYRSIGADGVSQIGHAQSQNGLNFETRSSHPIFQPLPDSVYLVKEEKRDKRVDPPFYNPQLYYSGGSWGGYEDPRAVRIEDRVYMTYVAFQGWNSVRIAMTSIDVKDLEANKWNWKKPTYISPANQVNKNWVLFPEKINGKFAILHSITPKVLIDYVDRLDDMIAAPTVKSNGPKGGREEHWDNWVRGAGPPPIRTKYGWLLLYHAMDRKDPDKYKIGAMILDHDNPTRILYRSPEPILEPNMPYENDGKPGVVYATGAVIDGDMLNVYYGAGDRHVAVAQTPLSQLLEWLVNFGRQEAEESGRAFTLKN